MTDKTKTEYLIRPKSNFSLGWQELWQYRELLYFFAWRDIKVKYKQATLGIIWAVLQPLLLAVLFTLIFSKGLKLDSGNLPYPVFALAGTALWQFFSGSVQSAATSMVSHANIIKKIYFPRLAIPLAAILAAAFDFIFAIMAVFAVAFFYGIKLNMPEAIMLIPTALLLIALPACGLGLWLSALNVKYRDFQYVLPFLLQLLFFASPIMYPSSILGEGLFAEVLSWNPVSSGCQLLRAAFSGESLQVKPLLKSIISGTVLFFAGIYFFRKMEAFFADLA